MTGPWLGRMILFIIIIIIIMIITTSFCEKLVCVKFNRFMIIIIYFHHNMAITFQTRKPSIEAGIRRNAISYITLNET